MQSQQTNGDGPRCESGDERAMVTSPPRSPHTPQTDLRDHTPSPPSGPNNSCGNGPVWTDDAGLDNPAFEESTEEDSKLIYRPWIVSKVNNIAVIHLFVSFCL